MSYLYGDSSPSQLTSNFIEFLGDALDVSVHLLQSSERIKRALDKIEGLKADAEAEIAGLEALGAQVAAAVSAAGGPNGGAVTPTGACAAAIVAQATELVRAQIAAVNETLAGRIAAVEAEEALERQGCEKALEKLLQSHDPPSTSSSYHFVHAAGRYLCKRTGITPYGLEWVLDLAISSPHPLSQAARVDRFAPQLEITAPEVGGWLRKEVRNRQHRLERHYLAGMTFTPEGGTLRLRASLDEGATGFDVEVTEQPASVKLQRGGEQSEVVEASEGDVAKLMALYTKVKEVALEIPRGQAHLDEAKLDEQPFVELSDPAALVDRLVEAMAPIVLEIAQHSQSPSELVLKRLLGDNRREEIFISKATLARKLDPLADGLRTRFQPLRLTVTVSRPPTMPVPAAVVAMHEIAAEAS